MIILDTDHVSVLQFEDTQAAARLLTKLEQAEGEQIATTIVTAEENMRGWLASTSKRRKVENQVPFHERLHQLLDLYAHWLTLPFNAAAAQRFNHARSLKIRVKPKDLKIASIALVHQARLLSANLADFRQIPGLVVEDWLHD